MARLRWLDVVFPPQRSDFRPRPVCVAFVVDKVATGVCFLLVFRFRSVWITFLRFFIPVLAVATDTVILATDGIINCKKNYEHWINERSVYGVHPCVFRGTGNCVSRLCELNGGIKTVPPVEEEEVIFCRLSEDCVSHLATRLLL